MNIEKSLQRIHWRFSSGNSFKPNQSDIEALNFVVEWSNQQKEKSLKGQQLFAKLYTMYFGELLLHYRDIGMAQRQLNKELGQTTDYIVERFRSNLNAVTFEDAHNKLGLTKKHPAMCTDEETAHDLAILQDNQNFFLHHLDKWTDEAVRKSLDNTISEAINKYKNVL